MLLNLGAVLALPAVSGGTWGKALPNPLSLSFSFCKTGAVSSPPVWFVCFLGVWGGIHLSIYQALVPRPAVDTTVHACSRPLYIKDVVFAETLHTSSPIL